jgi:transketolase
MAAKNLHAFSKEIKRLVIEQSYRAHVGHIGCSLSIADILAALYGDFLHISSPKDPDRDHLILSKGHAALGVYAALHLSGILSKKQLASYHSDDSQIGTHPEFGVPGIELMTGSLGQGLGVAAGIAFAKKMKKTLSKTAVILSDAECNEGSVWEAAAFCAHHELNITAIIDLNGQQGFGYTKDVVSMGDMAAKWKAFGWTVVEVNGHDPAAIHKVLVSGEKKNGPKMYIAKTKLGKGVSFMEGKVDWHYMPLTDDQYAQAIEEISHA